MTSQLTGSTEWSTGRSAGWSRDQARGRGACLFVEDLILLVRELLLHVRLALLLPHARPPQRRPLCSVPPVSLSPPPCRSLSLSLSPSPSPLPPSFSLALSLTHTPRFWSRPWLRPRSFRQGRRAFASCPRRAVSPHSPALAPRTAAPPTHAEHPARRGAAAGSSPGRAAGPVCSFLAWGSESGGCEVSADTPLSTGEGTRRVRLVRGKGHGVTA